ncbi:MAG: helix-turn-helix domain-containing protein [Nitrospirae bacterium]|nr:helix-turn-helix domain-containing protein [Nitrospirota bacterium]
MRERAGLTIEQLSGLTKVSPATIEAIEDDRALGTLPELFYRAHVIEILRALGEDPQPWSPRLALLLGQSRQATPPPAPSPSARRRRLAGLGAAASVLGLLVLWGSLPRSSPPTLTEPPASPIEGPVTVEVISREFTTVEYAADGGPAAQLYLREGERAHLIARRRLRVTLLRPSAVDVIYRGEKVDLSAERGSVARLEFPRR